VLEEDPESALAHARFARSRGSRIAAVREATGVAAYHTGEWSEALAELRTARRLGGGPGQLALLADCERALGRPERALEIARGPEAAQLGTDAAIELRIVAAGARRDLGQFDAAVVALQGPDLDADGPEPWRARLRYAYADNLLAAGREQDAIRWFLAAADSDVAEETDAAQRATELSDQVGLR
jgi:tetratricopeptide (TPR) repeat protein